MNSIDKNLNKGDDNNIENSTYDKFKLYRIIGILFFIISAVVIIIYKLSQKYELILVFKHISLLLFISVCFLGIIIKHNPNVQLYKIIVLVLVIILAFTATIYHLYQEYEQTSSVFNYFS